MTRSGFRTRPGRATLPGMADFMSHYAVPVAIGAVAVVLLLGLINMMRGGSGNTSQKLMRLRVLLQFIAIVVIMFTVWIMSK
jgi:hypothetical protein